MNEATQMFDIFDNFAKDRTLEVEGAVLELAPGAWVKVARADNPRYTRLLAKLMADHQEGLAKDNDSADDLANNIMAEVFAKTILKGFGGSNFAYKGKVVEYSYELALDMLKHQDFRVKVGALAQRHDAFKAKLEADQGNR